MKLEARCTVDSFVCDNMAAAKVLSKHGIDFCSEGNRSLKDACAEAGVSLKKLEKEIKLAEASRENKQPDPTAIDLDKLTEHIENYHHHFTAENIIFIRTSLSRLVRLYGRKYPEVIAIRNLFEEMTGRLTVHMQHEEFIVFPYIRELARKGRKIKSSIYKSANSPISGMLIDHDAGAAWLKKLDELTHHFSPPAEGNAFKLTYAAMRDLESDLHTHLALENEVLFPKALQMEMELNITTWTTALPGVDEDGLPQAQR